MTTESEWRDEWASLRAERAVARARWRSAADELAVRARDPLGLGNMLRVHPVVAGGIGAAAAALLVKMFLGRGGAESAGASHGDGPDRRNGAARPAPRWTSVLRDAAVSVAVPWLLRLLKDKFGADADAVAAPPPGPATAPAAGRVTPHRPG